MPPRFEDALLVLFVSPGALTDAGGYIFTPHGIIPVPGWGPEVVADLAAAATLQHQATHFRGSTTVKRELEAVANNIVQKRGDDIRAYSQQIAGVQAT